MVVYVPDPTHGSVFVITALRLGSKAPEALRRRRSHKAVQAGAGLGSRRYHVRAS